MPARARLGRLLQQCLAPVPALGQGPDGAIGDGIEGDPELPDPAGLVPAAVLVPVVTRDHAPSVLFTQRTAHLQKHAGQVSFPGGRVENDDCGYAAAALRETHEEVGLAPENVHVIGALDECRTGSGFRVTPVVGMVAPGFQLRPDPFEVADVFEVPLGFLLDPANHVRERIHYQGRLRGYHALQYRGHRIWGVTAAIVVNLQARARRAGLLQSLLEYH
ncbi:MAG: CoA pyrophosphatase [Gammaproteobacteria bacterium]